MGMNRLIAGSRRGLGSWLAQRATAVVMMLSLLLLFLALMVYSPHDYPSWKKMISIEWVRITIFMFLVSLAWHAWIGMRDIYMDYIHHTGLRLLKLFGLIVYFAACIFWGARILWG